MKHATPPIHPTEVDLAHALRELATIVARAVEPGEDCRRLGPLWALRCPEPTEPSHAVYGPMLCVVAQGAKAISVGDTEYRYDAGRFLLITIALPAAGRVSEASAEHPCLWVMIELDPSLVAEVVAEVGSAAPPNDETRRATDASAIDLPILEAIVRFARLLDSPRDAGFLTPLLMREIVYRLLSGEASARLRQIAGHGGEAGCVLKAIEWLRRNYDRPMTVEGLARECGLSPSSLHHHFKRVTAMSPLQFQKRIRLQEAKRLMIGEGLVAGSAGVRVGYEDPSYFSREYRRYFGDPPRKHVERMRGEFQERVASA